MDFAPIIWLLAADEEKAPAQPGGLDMMAFLPFIAIAVIFYVLLIRPQRREQSTREAMLAALKKNDKVVTIGGVIGSVANISPHRPEVTLKVYHHTPINLILSCLH